MTFAQAHALWFNSDLGEQKQMLAQAALMISRSAFVPSEAQLIESAAEAFESLAESEQILTREIIRILIKNHHVRKEAANAVKETLGDAIQYAGADFVRKAFIEEWDKKQPIIFPEPGK